MKTAIVPRTIMAALAALVLTLAACSSDGSVFETNATASDDGAPATTRGPTTSLGSSGGMTPVQRETIDSIGEQFSTTETEDACLVDGLLAQPALFESIDTDYTQDPEVAAAVFAILQNCVDSATLGQYIADGIAAEAPDLDATTIACMGTAVATADPAILAEFARFGTDPTYVPTDAAYGALADVLIGCDFQSLITDLFAAELANDPNITPGQVVCITDGVRPLFDRSLIILLLRDADAAMPSTFEAAITALTLDCLAG